MPFHGGMIKVQMSRTAPGPPAPISVANPKPSPVQEIVHVDASPIRLNILKCLVSSWVWPFEMNISPCWREWRDTTNPFAGVSCRQHCIPRPAHRREYLAQQCWPRVSLPCSGFQSWIGDGKESRRLRTTYLLYTHLRAYRLHNITLASDGPTGYTE
jgi:hypothetical protein